MAQAENISISQVAQGLVVQFHRRSYEMMIRQWNMRESMRIMDLAYAREQDWSETQWKAYVANNWRGDQTKIQNLTLPVIQPQIRAAVSYQVAIFAADYPLFPVVASPQYIDQAHQMQAVIEENSIRCAYAREMSLFFFDGFKYNISALEVAWEKRSIPVFETDLSFQGGREASVSQVAWQGNVFRRWDMYNTYWDTRCTPFDIPDKGEFVGHTEVYSRVALKNLILSLQTALQDNVKKAFESPSTINVSMTGNGTEGYYIPWINPNVLVDPTVMDLVNWDAWMNNLPEGPNRTLYKGIYEVSTEYARIIPSEFGIIAPAKNTPQIWKFIIVNHSVVIYAERQTNAHQKIPVFFGTPTDSGLAYQDKSLTANALPFQQVGSAVMNGILAGRRRAVTDRVLYDPSRISEAQINNPNPSAKIPVRPSAYGKPVAEAAYQFPYREDQAGSGFQEIQQILGLANSLAGQNSVRQGQFVKGNKTDSQWDSVMNNATSADQLYSLLYEAQVFTGIKEVMKINILQYQGKTTIYSPSQEKEVKVDPIALRNATMNFKVTDGFLPAEKVMNSETLTAAAQIIGSSPAIAQGYNVAPMFSYLFKTQNVDLRAFEKSPQQVAYEQALGAWNNIMMTAAQKGVTLSQPQPKPQDYGYDPAMSTPSAQGAASLAAPETSPTTGT